MGTNTPPPEFGDSEPDDHEPGTEPGGFQLPRYENPDPTPTPDGVPGPLGVFETVSVSFGLYRADVLKLWQVVALVIIPVQVLLFILRELTVPHAAYLHNGVLHVFPGTDGGYLAVTSLGSILTELVVLVSVGAAYRILLGRHLHHPADLMTSFRFAIDRLWSLVWVSFLVFLLTLVGFICIIIPGIYLAFALVLAVPVLMAEDLRGWAATARSRQLVSGHWWHVFGAMFVAFIVAGIGVAIVAVLLAPIDKAIFPHSITGLFVITGVVNTLISIVFSPFTAAVPVVLYVDMLVRKNDPQLQRLLA